MTNYDTYHKICNRAWNYSFHQLRQKISILVHDRVEDLSWKEVYSQIRVEICEKVMEGNKWVQ